MLDSRPHQDRAVYQQHSGQERHHNADQADCDRQRDDECRCGRHGRSGSSTSLPSTPPSASSCNAPAAFDSGYRTGGGGLRPAATSWLTPKPNTCSAPRWVRKYSPHPTPSTPTLRSSSLFTLTAGIPPAAKPSTSNLPSGANARMASSNTSPPTGSTTMSTPAPPV